MRPKFPGAPRGAAQRRVSKLIGSINTCLSERRALVNNRPIRGFHLAECRCPPRARRTALCVSRPRDCENVRQWLCAYTRTLLYVRVRRAAGTQSIPVASPDRHFISRRSLSPPHPAAHTQSRGSLAGLFVCFFLTAVSTLFAAILPILFSSSFGIRINI